MLDNEVEEKEHILFAQRMHKIKQNGWMLWGWAWNMELTTLGSRGRSWTPEGTLAPSAPAIPSSPPQEEGISGSALQGRF